MSNARASTGRSLGRMAFFLILGPTLVVAGVAWAVRVSGVAVGDLRRLITLPWPTILGLGLLFVGLYGTDVYPYRLLGEALAAANLMCGPHP